MTETEQRIAIAESKGWHSIHHGGTVPLGIPPGIRASAAMYEESLPNYLHDLNAIRGAVMTLPVANRHAVENNLFSIAHRNEQSFVELNAEDWSEAYLRAIGKWKE